MNSINNKKNCLLYLVPELVWNIVIDNGKASKKIRVKLLPWRSEVTSLYMTMDKETPSLNVLLDYHLINIVQKMKTANLSIQLNDIN